MTRSASFRTAGVSSLSRARANSASASRFSASVKAWSLAVISSSTRRLFSPPAPAAAAEPGHSGSRVVFGPLPEAAPPRMAPLPSWPLRFGAALGLCLGALWIAVRELTGSGFATVFEARRRIDVPIVAAIPRFDPVSLAAVAKDSRGRIEIRDGRKAYIPAPVEIMEPPPLGRRRALTPARRRRKSLAWIMGALLLASAAGVRQFAVGDLWPPVSRPGRTSGAAEEPP